MRNEEWLEKEIGSTETEYAITEKCRAEYREFLNKQSKAEENEERRRQRMAKRSLFITCIYEELVLMLCSEKNRSDQDVAR